VGCVAKRQPECCKQNTVMLQIGSFACSFCNIAAVFTTCVCNQKSWMSKQSMTALVLRTLGLRDGDDEGKLKHV